MTNLVGTGALIRLILRQERARLTAWVIFLSALPVITARSFAELYPTQQSREAIALTVGANPALGALFGPLHDSGIGGLTTWRMAVVGAVLIGIMAVLTVVRHTREEEQTGRRELLGSTVLGRHAPLAAALLVAAGAGITIGVIQAVGMIGIVGLPASGSIAFGVGFAGTCFVFASVGAVAAQLTEGAGSARGIGIAVIGASFMVRVAGDTGGLPALAWLSPFGWLVNLRSFAGESWAVAALWPALGMALAALAFFLASRRDVGAGAFRPRPGDARAGALLSGPLGLTWRLHRGGLMGWSVGLAAIGLVYGGVADGMGDFLTDTPQLAEIFELLGGERGITDAFFIAAVGLMALIASAYSIRAVLRLRDEEELLRAEMVLATATTRHRWAISHLVFGLIGPVVMLVVGGAVAGGVYGSMVGDVPGEATRVMTTALVQTPAVWVLTGVAMAAYGALPRRTGVAWWALVACLVLGQLGQILQFPQWALNLSPFSHTPRYPAEIIQVLPMVVLTFVALALLVLGLATFRRRDIPSV